VEVVARVSTATETAVLVVVIGARLLVPLALPRYPLPAIVAALAIDAADQTLFDAFTGRELARYQTYDKALDIYYLAIAYVSVLRNWTNGVAVEVARFLWYLRLVGVTVFEVTEQRLVLMVFANTFEYFFIAYEIIRCRWDPRRLARRAWLIVAGVLWIGVKLPQEWWVHVAQRDVTDTLAAHPSVGRWVLAGAGMVLVLAVALWKWAPGDWSLRFDVDRPLPHEAVWRSASYPGSRDPGPPLRWPVIEKTVMIALVAIIFGQLLQLASSNLQIFLGTGAVVVVNVIVSPLVIRRRRHWRVIAREFVILGVLNTVLISLYASVVADDGINRAAAFFFGALFTLLITFYDRYRRLRLDWMHGDTPADGPAPVATDR
jgi:hypothetical protein